MQISDILIHLDDSTDQAGREILVEHLRGIDSVIAPRFNEEKSHLLLVSYNPEATNSLTLLHAVTDRGYSAQLVGL